MDDRVTMWFDPACPFTWQTSRWLVDSAQQRGVAVDWRPMSLAVLNEGREIPEQYRAGVQRSVRALRILTAVQERGGSEALGAVYTALGRRVHEDGRDMDGDVLAEALAEAGLPADLAAAADDTDRDATVRASHDEGQHRVGKEAGSPVLAFGGGPGYFGPVVAPAPTGEEALRLFDAVRLLSQVPSFSELTRSREPWTGK
jgi:2-hydroxychromene-2-carboxylate isomerase